MTRPHDWSERDDDTTVLMSVDPDRVSPSVSGWWSRKDSNFSSSETEQQVETDAAPAEERFRTATSTTTLMAWSLHRAPHEKQSPV